MMKKVLRFCVVLLCVVIFSSLLFIAVKQIGNENKEPKSPISVSFMSITRSTDPTSILVELPEDHHADKILVFWGDELGRFEPSVATFDVAENPMVCAMPKDLVMPENATMLWVYTANEYGISESGYSLSLVYAPDPSALDEEKSADNNVEQYAVIAIAVAILLSVLGYVWLGKKSPDELKNTEETNK